MLDFLAILFLTIGYLVTAIAIGYLIFFAIDKASEARARRKAHDKHLVTLLESINQKLDTKP